MNKAVLRKIYKQKRLNLSEKEVEKLQENIYEQVFKIDYSSFKNIHIFLPIEKQKELNTFSIIHFLWSQHKKVVVSKSNFSNATLSHFILERDTQLKVNSYGIPEPVNAKEIAVSEIDAVFVPLLISDTKKYRVGYGKGFYDRFLSECKTTIKTIGLNFFQPIEKIEDINKFDISLDEVIFPK